MSKPPKQAAPAPANMLALDNQFCFALYSASHAVTKTYKPLLDRLGLTYPQYLVMLVLWEQDAVLVKDIGARLFLDSGTLTPLLKRLEANGLVERNRDPQDERQVRISLSTAGRTLRAAAMAIPEQLLCASGQQALALGRLRSELSAVRDNLFKSMDGGR
jgi:DNA-binding MarR family transcriptional regulator